MNNRLQIMYLLVCISNDILLLYSTKLFLVNMDSENSETQIDLVLSTTSSEPINYDQCCLFKDKAVHGCGLVLYRK